MNLAMSLTVGMADGPTLRPKCTGWQWLPCPETKWKCFCVIVIIAAAVIVIIVIIIILLLLQDENGCKLVDGKTSNIDTHRYDREQLSMYQH